MNRPLAVYVHVPFCTVKCGYCDFNAYSGMDNLKAAYGRALVREVEVAAGLFVGRTVGSIGFGGGTPGEVPASDIGAVIAAIRGQTALAPDAEVSLEVNPGTTTGRALRELRESGVNRLSIGAQSFNAHELRFLDRIHSPEASAATLRLARGAGFASVGLDLIYGLPGQEQAEWRESIESAISLRPDHVSAYALTIEDGTPLARRVRKGEVVPLEGDAVADLYELATDILEGAGFEQYEISNWARPGHQSHHNRTYWTDAEYLGIGAGAHGYIAGERYENVARPADYIAAVECPGRGSLAAVANRYVPDAAMAVGDWITLRLRLLEGFEPSEFEFRFQRPLPDSVRAVFEECHEAGVLEASPRVRLTRAGRLLHGEVAARVLAALNRDSVDPGPGFSGLLGARHRDRGPR